MKTENRFSLLYMLARQKVEIQILTAISGILIGFGILNTFELDPNGVMLFDIMSKMYWSILFFTYGIIKFLCCIFKIPHKICMFSSILGIWMWNCMFLSFIIYNSSKINPTEFLLLVPLISEFWIMLSSTFNKNNCCEVKNVK